MAIGQNSQQQRSGPGARKGKGKFARKTPRNTMAKMRANQRKPSYLAEHRIEFIDYKDVKLLQKFTNAQGKILPRRITRLTPSQQHQLTSAIKVARHLALMPFVQDSEAY